MATRGRRCRATSPRRRRTRWRSTRSHLGPRHRSATGSTTALEYPSSRQASGSLARTHQLCTPCVRWLALSCAARSASRGVLISTTPASFTQPTPTPGRARYAAILERSAAQQLQPAVARRSPSDAPESGAAPRSDEQNVPLEGLSHSRTSAAQDRRGADTSEGSELGEDGAPPSAQLSDNGEASSAAKRGHPIRVELAQPQPQAHAPAHTHAHANPRTPTPAQQRTHRPAPAPPDAHTLHAATRVSAHGPSSEAGRSSAAGGLDGYEAGGEGAKAGGEGTGVAQGKEEETGWTIWEDEVEIEKV